MTQQLLFNLIHEFWPLSGPFTKKNYIGIKSQDSETLYDTEQNQKEI